MRCMSYSLNFLKGCIFGTIWSAFKKACTKSISKGDTNLGWDQILVFVMRRPPTRIWQNPLEALA